MRAHGVTTRVGAALVALATSACSGRTTADRANDDDPRDAGSDDAGDGGPARPARVGLTLTLRTESTIPETMGRTCGTGTGVTWDIGNPSPSSSSPGATVEDGVDDAAIACSVTSGGEFRVQASGRDPQIAAGSMPELSLVNVTFSGTASAGEEVAASVYTTATFAIATNTGFPSCTLSAVHEVKAGALWAGFNCPALTDPSRPAVACRASGAIVIEYCETELPAAP